MPGKFEGCYDEKIGRDLYEITLDGDGDVIGERSNPDAGWWSALILFPLGLTDKDGTEFTAFIVNEDEQGFFTYEGFATEDEAYDFWDKMDTEPEEDYDSINEPESEPDRVTWSDIAANEKEE